MTSVESLQKRICELEEQLVKERSKNDEALSGRQKIAQMSSEVVDSNPYR